MVDDSTGDVMGRSWTELSLSTNGDNTLERTDTVRTIGRLKLRGKTDDLPQYSYLSY